MASGTPYDTILPTLRELSRHGLAVEVCEPGAKGPRIEAMHPQRGDVVYVQRSRGYSGRRSWGKAEISRLVEWAHAHGAQVIVDNCYGEFTHSEEPGHWGADLVVGSLMKNPGGAVAPTGAYAAGTQVWIDAVADALFAPGIGAEVGATGPYLRLFAQGLFLAPLLVGEALKGGVYISERAQRAGFQVDPAPDDWDRNDIVVAVELGSAERVVRFCQIIQSFEPIDGFVTPEPWDMPGYDHPVIMAAGGFVAGGSLELSCDAPIRPPYHVYIQGGINRWHTMAAVDAAFGTLV
jgi:cystathionine beta-lyase family protein involved in aluminum resistance